MTRAPAWFKQGKREVFKQGRMILLAMVTPCDIIGTRLPLRGIAKILGYRGNVGWIRPLSTYIMLNAREKIELGGKLTSYTRSYLEHFSTCPPFLIYKKA